VFFVLSKTIGFLLVPTNLLIATSVVLLAIASFSPLGNALLWPLENRFPAWDPVRGSPDGIVVLGGAISAEIAGTRGTLGLSRRARVKRSFVPDGGVQRPELMDDFIFLFWRLILLSPII
jgi:hypothetical protein